MRSDMAKVLVEDGRRGENPGLPRKERRKLNNPKNWEDGPTRSAGRKRRFGYEAKELTDFLTPLWRFLESRVGKHWDKVYSEICENLSPSSTMQKHLLDHLKQAVNLDVVMVGSIPHEHRPDGSLKPLYAYRRYRGFYVNPITKLLKLTPVEKTVKPKKTREDGFRDGERWVFKRDGFWYSSDLKKFIHDKTLWAYDHFRGKEVERHWFGWKHSTDELLRDGLYCATKPDFVSKKDMRRLGLTNGC